MPSLLHETMNGDSSSSFGYADPFTPSRSRRKRKNRPDKEPLSPSALLDRTREEISTSDWLHESIQLLRDTLAPLPSAPPSVLCLGLGSPSGSRDARAQLVFLLAVCSDLSIDRAKVAMYDPVFTEQDVELLDTLAVTRLAENSHAFHRVEGPTIVFMPHCDLQLHENLLRENWSRERLPNLVLIANRLSDYADSVPSRKLSVAHPCVSRLTPYLTSRLLPVCSACPTAFNNTAIQVARLDGLDSANGDWWDVPPRALGADT